MTDSKQLKLMKWFEASERGEKANFEFGTVESLNPKWKKSKNWKTHPEIPDEKITLYRS